MDELKDQNNEKNEGVKGQPSLASRLMAIFISPKKGMEIAAQSPMIIGMMVILVISAMLIYIPQRPMFLKMTMTAVENSKQSFSADEIDTLITGGANAAMFMSMFYFNDDVCIHYSFKIFKRVKLSKPFRLRIVFIHLMADCFKQCLIRIVFDKNSLMVGRSLRKLPLCVKLTLCYCA